MEEYKIKDIASNGYMYVEIRKMMYGLKEPVIITFNQLVSKLAPHGYQQIRHTPVLWTHKTRNIHFTLAMDDFGVKYFDKQDAEHFFDALSQYYKISTN